MKLEEVIDMSTEFEFDAKVKEADDIDIKEYSFSPTLLENGVIDYINDFIFEEDCLVFGLTEGYSVGL